MQGKRAGSPERRVRLFTQFISEAAEERLALYDTEQFPWMGWE